MAAQLRGLLMLMLGSVLLSGAAQADEPSTEKTFYTILTPDGLMQVEMPVPSRRAPVPKPAASVAVTVAEPPPVPAVLPTNPPLLPATTAARPARTANPAAARVAIPEPAPSRAPDPVQTTAPQSTASPFFDFAGQQYVDTAYLEQREFNLEGRKRFYSLPDGLGGTQVFERESGVRLSGFIPQFERPPVVSLAENYRQLTASTLVDLTNQQCLSAAQLKTAKLLDDKPVDLWPRPGFEPKFEFVLTELVASLRNIHLMSYSATSRRPSYYWPLPIFLDQRGCVLEGVAGFYQSKTPATWLQQSALQGHLHIPKDARYLLLTPLVEAAELSGETLADRGQLRLTPLRLATP